MSTWLSRLSWPHRPLIANIHADLFELAQRITATLFALPKHCFLVNMLGSIFFDLVANACWESAPRWRLGVTTWNWARKKKNLPFKRSCCNAESVLFLTFMFIFKKKKKVGQRSLFMNDPHVLSLRVNMTQNRGHVIQANSKQKAPAYTCFLLLRPDWLAFMAGTVVLCHHTEWCHLCLRGINKRVKESVCLCALLFTLIMFSPSFPPSSMSSSLRSLKGMILCSFTKKKNSVWSVWS